METFYKNKETLDEMLDETKEPDKELIESLKKCYAHPGMDVLVGSELCRTYAKYLREDHPDNYQREAMREKVTTEKKYQDKENSQ